MPAFEDIFVKNDSLVRKALQGGVYLGRHPTAPDITTLHAADGIISLPASYESVGWISDEGLTFGNDQEVAEVRPWGSGHFIRRDITSTDRTLAFAALETKRLTWELRSGLNLSAVTASAEGEVVVTHPDRMPTQYWRALALGVDGDGAQRYHMGKFYPRSVVSETEEEAWSDGDDPLSYGVTLSALIDSDIGTPCREFLFGPGALAAAAAMGWTVSTLTAPANLAVGTETATTAPLTWDAVTGADGYIVLRSVDDGDNYTDVASAAGGEPSTNSTTVTGLTTATEYRFRVQAVSAAGTRGPLSASVVATTT